MSDDSAYVQGFASRGLKIPPGYYRCLAGIVIPGTYIQLARASGREPDFGANGFLLSGDPPAVIRGAGGEMVVLSGGVSPPAGTRGGVPGDIVLARDGTAIRYA